MAKRSITLELDDETIRHLAVLGKPNEVLALLAYSAADGAQRHGQQPQRDQTDESLRVERDKADAGDAEKREAVDQAADEVVRIARHRADQTVQIARDDADRRSQSTASEAISEGERSRADVVLEHERSTADAKLGHERAERRRYRAEFLAVERDATDMDLSGERSIVDKLIVDQREANEQMIGATIRAQELSIEADAAKERAEGIERELRAVAEFREMFIGILGHDLRNPLGSIGMAAALLLRRGHLDEQDAATAARIIRSGQRMTRMVTQLLDLTRARLGGGLPIEPKPTDLREVCRNVVEEFEATIRLEVEGDVTGTWDHDRLAEVVSNLTGNAVEYAAPGTLVLVKAQADETEVVVEISNRGDPIPEEVMPFIFEPFRRARKREKSATGNLGLGLYIAQQIVLSHGGTLGAHSADGTTTFVMRLPRCSPLRPGEVPQGELEVSQSDSRSKVQSALGMPEGLKEMAEDADERRLRPLPQVPGPLRCLEPLAELARSPQTSPSTSAPSM
jgi:signal transduction histidine kinase